MADEASIRIQIDDEGGGAGSTRGGRARSDMDMQAPKWADPRNIHDIADPTMMERLSQWQQEQQPHWMTRAMSEEAARQERDRVYEAEESGISVLAEPLIDLEKEAKKTADQLNLLTASMYPEAIRQRVAAELELAQARQRLNTAMEAERQKQAPYATEVTRQNFAQTLPRPNWGGLLPGGMTPGPGPEKFNIEAPDVGRDIKRQPSLLQSMGTATVFGAVFGALKQLESSAIKAAGAIGSMSATAIQANSSTASSVQAVGAFTDALGDNTFTLLKIPAAFISGMGQAMQQIEGLADRYGQYSPEIAQAQAFADMRQQLGDLSRAQEAAPDLINYINESSQAQQRFEEAKLRILNRIMPGVLKGMALAEKMLPVLEAILGMIGSIANLIPGAQIEERVNDVAEILRQMNAPGLEIPNSILRQGDPFARVRESHRGVF